MPYDSWQYTTRIRIGFKSRNQLPWFMIWREHVSYNVEHADVLFNTDHWRRTRDFIHNTYIAAIGLAIWCWLLYNPAPIIEQTYYTPMQSNVILCNINGMVGACPTTSAIVSSYTAVGTTTGPSSLVCTSGIPTSVITTQYSTGPQ